MLIFWDYRITCLFALLIYHQRNPVNASRDNLWISLQQEVAELSLEGNVILTGDFNAQTGQLQVFIKNDSDDHLPLPVLCNRLL